MRALTETLCRDGNNRSSDGRGAARGPRGSGSLRCLRQARRDGRERGPGQPVRHPFGHRDRAHPVIELPSRIPVEYPPLQSWVPPLDADLGERGQERGAQAVAARGRSDVEVLEIDAVATLPCGEIQEPQHRADRLAVLVVCDVTEQRRVRREQRGAQVILGQAAFVRGSLVGGEFVHHIDHSRYVLGTHRLDRELLCHACLVSQKILEISSILPRSWSATAGSAEPFVPAAPASFVASLNSWCRFGYFSKCGGLK